MGIGKLVQRSVVSISEWSFLTIPRLISSVVRAIVGSAERPMQACMSRIGRFREHAFGFGFIFIVRGWWRRWFLWFGGFREWSIPVVDRNSSPSIIRFVVLGFMDFGLGDLGSDVNPCVSLDLSICPRRGLMEVWFRERCGNGYEGEGFEIDGSRS